MPILSSRDTKLQDMANPSLTLQTTIHLRPDNRIIPPLHHLAHLLCRATRTLRPLD